MLDYDSLVSFIELVAENIGVPVETFGDAREDFIRFDFDGDGGLECHECYRLVKSHLKAFRKKLGHNHGDHTVPTKSLQQVGLTLGKTLGHGAFGTVMLATD